MFSGTLTEFTLAQVLELLHASNQSGELVLRRGDERIGSVYLHVGQLTHASVGQFEGLDALNQLVSATDSSFVFDAGVLPVEQSLAAYPTDRLLDRLRKQVEGFKQLLSAAPLPDARPTYRPVSGPLGIPASTEEIGLLFLSNGQRTIAEIAHLGGVSVQFVAETMAKFRQANLITLSEKSQAPASPPAVTTILPQAAAVPSPASPQAPPPPPPGEPPPLPPPKAPTRYWRGRPIN